MLRSAHLVYLGDGNQTNLILIPHLYKDDTIKKCGVDMVKKEDKSKIKKMYWSYKKNLFYLWFFESIESDESDKYTSYDNPINTNRNVSINPR